MKLRFYLINVLNISKTIFVLNNRVISKNSDSINHKRTVMSLFEGARLVFLYFDRALSNRSLSPVYSAAFPGVISDHTKLISG